MFVIDHYAVWSLYVPIRQHKSCRQDWNTGWDPKFEFALSKLSGTPSRSCGLMDKAPDFGSGDCRFESCHDRNVLDKKKPKKQTKPKYIFGPWGRNYHRTAMSYHSLETSWCLDYWTITVHVINTSWVIFKNVRHTENIKPGASAFWEIKNQNL